MLAFTGSNSSKSINEQLIKAVLKTLDLPHDFIDLKSLGIPMFSEDLEQEIGLPDGIKLLKKHIEEHEHIFIAVNEHNGHLSAFLKNILDWLSRIDVKFLQGKKVFILSTSGGKRGGLGANETMQHLVKRFGCETYDWAVFPSFNENFDKENQRILNDDLRSEISLKLTTFLNN